MDKQLIGFRRAGIHVLSSLLLSLLLIACGAGGTSTTTITPTAGTGITPPISQPTATPTATHSGSTPTPTPTAGSTPVSPKSALIPWPAFDGGGSRSGVNSTESIITPSNVASLTKFWQRQLPDIADSSPVELPDVATASGVKTLIFVTTLKGSIQAIDAATGNTIWHQETQGPNITTSSPAVDPSHQFVYSYGVDGMVHKYVVGTGDEITSGGWPATITLMPNDEKGSSSLNIGNGYLYMTISGYNGDGGHYNGHVVAVNLSSGAETVYNVLCSNIHQLLDNVSSDPNYCGDIQAGIWARAGAVIDPVTGNIFITTGNGPYNADQGGNDYGDSVLELSPDLTRLIDSYTPENYAQLQQDDSDLGSAAPAFLPIQVKSKTPYLAVQAGKDNKLRLLNRQNLSGQGGPNHVGGEIQSFDLPQGCEVRSHPAVWNDSSNTTWVFVANDCGLSAMKVVTDSNGQTTLQTAYQNGNGGSSPFIANNILFVQGNNVLRAMSPTTGEMLWSTAIGGLHWQSPIVVNGQVYVVDQDSNMIAYTLKQ